MLRCMQMFALGYGKIADRLFSIEKLSREKFASWFLVIRHCLHAFYGIINVKRYGWKIQGSVNLNFEDCVYSRKMCYFMVINFLILWLCFVKLREYLNLSIAKYFRCISCCGDIGKLNTLINNNKLRRCALVVISFETFCGGRCSALGWFLYWPSLLIWIIDWIVDFYSVLVIMKC